MASYTVCKLLSNGVDDSRALGEIEVGAAGHREDGWRYAVVLTGVSEEDAERIDALYGAEPAKMLTVELDPEGYKPASLTGYETTAGRVRSFKAPEREVGPQPTAAEINAAYGCDMFEG